MKPVMTCVIYKMLSGRLLKSCVANTVSATTRNSRHEPGSDAESKCKSADQNSPCAPATAISIKARRGLLAILRQLPKKKMDRHLRQCCKRSLLSERGRSFFKMLA